MQLESLLCILVVLTSVISLIIANINAKLIKKCKKLEKRITGELTDFEILEFIVDLFCRVDFEKLRPDQIELWYEFLRKYVLNEKTDSPDHA